MVDNTKSSAAVSSKTSAAPSKAGPPRMSFASVAAMAPLGRPRPSANPGNTHPKTQEAGSPAAAKQGDQSVKPGFGKSPFRAEPGQPVQQLPNAVNRKPKFQVEGTNGLNDSLKRLDLRNDPAIVPDVPDHEVPSALQMRPKLDDEKTHLSFSSTKASSLDGKSVASGTTFAMDEKESIRPDDSASVKAAEDDDSNSGPVSGDPNSQVGSEAGSKAFRDQFNEISDRIGPGAPRPLPQIRRMVPDMTEQLRRGPFPQVAAMGPTASLARPDASILQNDGSEWKPDEKLLEAMETPKDRLFLLQLEQQVISFIRDSKDEILDLPPCNSFCRLLAHRLGDYYALSHFVDNSVSAVRLYRTPYCQLRTPLSELASKTTATEEGLISARSMKIMRRAGILHDGGSGANTAENSVGHSKAASETGDDGQRTSGITSPSETSAPKDKAATTREEREAKYKEARDRIFADWKEGQKNESTQTDETGNNMSRQSSSNGKKKKKHYKMDDGFDSRSAYNAYYPQRSGSYYEQSTGQMNYYAPYAPQMNGQALQLPNFQQPFPQPYHPAPPGQVYQVPPVLLPQPVQMPMPPQNQIQTLPPNPMVPNPNLYYPAVQPQVLPNGQAIPAQYYVQTQQPNQMPQLPANMPSPALSNAGTPLARPQQLADPKWAPGAYQNPYQGYPAMQTQYPTQMQMQPPLGSSPPQATSSYPFGQLPVQPNSQGSRSPHPLPGSYHRQHFNPQSRAFVPGTTFAGPPANMMNVSDKSPEQNPYYSYPNYVGGLAANNMGMPYMQPLPGAANLPPTFPGQHSSQHSNHHPTPRKGQMPISQSPARSTISKWGTPSTLPPKPPPPAHMSQNGTTTNTGGVQGFQSINYTATDGGQADRKITPEAIAIE